MRGFPAATIRAPASIYWSTAQAKPWARVSRGTDGDALYTNSTLAIDPETGKVVWHHQFIPGETHDMDEVFESVLVDRGGRRSLYKMGKLGILWQLDRADGKFVAAHDLGYQTLVEVDAVAGRAVLQGGHAAEARHRVRVLPRYRRRPRLAGDVVRPGHGRAGDSHPPGLRNGRVLRQGRPEQRRRVLLVRQHRPQRVQDRPGRPGTRRCPTTGESSSRWTWTRDECAGACL